MIFRFVLPLSLLLSSSAPLAQVPSAGQAAINCGCEDQPQVNVLAAVNGIKITKQDLSINTKTQVSLLHDTVIDARGRELDRQIKKVLIEAEAGRRGLSTAELLRLEVAAKVAPPTDKEARAFYEKNKNRLSPGFKSVKNDLIARLKSEREAVREKEFANSLRVAAKVTVSDQTITPPANDFELSRVFATVNGISITSRDIEEGLRPLIFRVQQQVYAYRKADLDLKINDLLLELEAKRQGMSPRALLDHAVRTKLPIVSEQQAKAFYNENKGTMRGGFSRLKHQIIQYLLAQEERKLSLAYAEQLRSEAAVQIYLTAPEAPSSRARR